MVTLVCLELCRYRRLRAVRLDLQDETTVLVGANDSGKSSLVLAIHKFLTRAAGRAGSTENFSAYDISADGWKTLIDLGRTWEQPTPASTDAETLREQHEKREEQLARLLGVMPTLDVWLEAQDGAWHMVRDLIPTLEWSGGRVGVRLRLEPVSNAEELDRLIEAYRNARARVRAAPTPGSTEDPPRRAWPADLFDYLKKAPSWFARVSGYKLDPVLLEDPTETGEARPQALSDHARALEDLPLRHLVRVDFIPAQRGLGSEEAASGGTTGGRQPGGLLSAQLVGYARGLLARDGAAANELENERHAKVAEALEGAHGLLDEAINAVLKDRVEEVRLLGYPSVADLQDIVLRAEVHPAEALRHRSAVQYRSSGSEPESMHLPEHAIGLGYQNLLSLTFALMRFRDDRLRLPEGLDETKAPPPPPAVHLVLLEEPEAHLHVQVQRTFIQRAHPRIVPKGHPELSAQLVVSTHSSHLAHAVDFAQLRYLRRLPREKSQPLPTSVIVSLAEVFGAGDPYLPT